MLARFAPLYPFVALTSLYIFCGRRLGLDNCVSLAEDDLLGDRAKRALPQLFPLFCTPADLHELHHKSYIVRKCFTLHHLLTRSAHGCAHADVGGCAKLVVDRIGYGWRVVVPWVLYML